MSEESNNGLDATERGMSRRTALKAGAAVGVGVAAWSGAKITSLGGTPAYAQACTGVIVIDLLPCRNTDQRVDCQFAYHQLNTALPTGFSLANNVPEGTCCEDNHVTTLNFPAGLTCVVHVNFNLPPQCTGTSVTSLPTQTSSSGTLPINLTCAPAGCLTPGPSVPPCTSFPSQTQYTIFANCATTGAPPGCL